MAKTRYLCAADNKFTPYNDEISSALSYGWKDGNVSGAIKYGLGSASLTALASGTTFSYSHYRDTIFTLEIDSVSAGKEIGQATFRWRSNFTTAGAWEASGVSTSALFTPFTCVLAYFTGGTGNDFELGDRWVFSYYSIYGMPRLSDQRRDTYFEYERKPDDPTFVGSGFWFDAGETVSVNCCALLDIMVTGTITAMDVTVAAYTAPGDAVPLWEHEFSVADIVNESLHKISYFTAASGRYFKISIVNTGVFGYQFRLGQLFLGTYRETNTPDYGSGISSRDSTSSIKDLSLKWDTMLDSDLATLRDVYDASKIDMIYPQPIYLQVFDFDDDSIYWVKPVGDLQHSFRALGINTVSLAFEEVAKNYVI